MHVRRGVGVLPWLLRALGEPTRRDVYLKVQQAGRPLSRVEVAERLGIARRLAAFHLDKLAAEGLLDVHYARPPDRVGGPGAGRPAKWYRPSELQIDVTIPPRRTDLAARIMASALEQIAPHGAPRQVLLDHARACGRALAEAGPPDLLDLLTEIGYEPVHRPDGTVELRNCPFHPAVRAAPDTTCSMNLSLLAGLTDAQQPQRYEGVLERAQGRCCVLLQPR
jgi:predicted ArsR family transcriptional regulator